MKSKEPTVEENVDASPFSEELLEDEEEDKKRKNRPKSRFLAGFSPETARALGVLTPPPCLPYTARQSSLKPLSDYESRRQRAATLRDQVEQIDLTRKFLLSHRKEINKQHVRLGMER